MSIQEVFYINLAVTIILSILLLVLPFVFRHQRKKYLDRERNEL